MNIKHVAGFSVFGALALMAAPSASASYMKKCEALIAEWDTCRETGAACKTEQKAIVEHCKCHKQKGDEWKLVMAAVGKDGVCAPEWPSTPVPDPSPPPHDKSNPPAPEQRGEK